MKTKSTICLLLMMLLFYSCESTKSPIDEPTKNDTVIIGTGHSQEEVLEEVKDWGGQSADPGSLACLTIVKFFNLEQEDKVIVQHPIKKYNGIDGHFEYEENTDLYLNVLDTSLVSWADEQMQIAGTSPYIPLADGYNLIDWKWHQLLPLSTLSSYWRNAYHNPFEEHILSHCFITDMNWKDIKDLTSGYEVSNSTKPVSGIEIIRVDMFALDCYYKDVKQNDPYLCWNMSLYYNNGMCYDNAYMYYKYGDCSHSGKSHRTYIDYCDSLQSVYQQRLTELINNGHFKEIGY